MDVKFVKCKALISKFVFVNLNYFMSIIIKQYLKKKKISINIIKMKNSNQLKP